MRVEVKVAQYTCDNPSCSTVIAMPPVSSAEATGQTETEGWFGCGYCTSEADAIQHGHPVRREEPAAPAAAEPGTQDGAPCS